MPILSRSTAVLAVCVGSAALVAASARAQAPAAGIPISVDLPNAAIATVVIDDASGKRIRNLVSELHLPAGRSVIAWDGYDEGQRSEAGDGDVWNHDLTRRRVEPGTYTIRGLVHERLSLHYEFSLNSPGTPPWKTADSSGGWLADHSPPADILYLSHGTPAPNGRGIAHFLVCSSAGESGEAFVWLDADGRRLFGTNTGFWGGTHLACDLGPKADPDTVAYTFISGERDHDNDSIEVRAIHADGKLSPAAKITFPLEWKKNGKLPQFKDNAEAYGANGLAVRNGIAVFTITRQDRVVFADVHTRKILGEDRAASPRSLLFDGQGRLLMVVGTGVVRFETPDLAAARLGKATPFVTDGLEEPRRLASDGDGRIYVTDWGSRHQVQVFSPEGKPLRTIGKPGGPMLGHYDERRMSHPAGLTVDRAGHLWVAECEQAPKRLSVWETNSDHLVRAIYGPSQYGGGGKIDGGNPTRLYMDSVWSVGGVTWALDWTLGSARPEGVFWRKDNPLVEAMPPTVPETVLRRGNHVYMTNAYNDYLRYNQDRGVGLWRLDAEGVARPVAIFGNGADLVNSTWGIPLRYRDAIVKKWQDLDPATVLYVWCDRSGDQIAQPDEVEFRQIPSPTDGKPLRDVGVGVQVNPDLSLGTTWGLHVAPPELDATGLTRYDLNKIDFLGDARIYSERVTANGMVVYLRIGSHGLTGSRADGTAFWRHQSVSGGQPGPGQLAEPNRILGLPVTPRTGEAGTLVAFNGEKGSIFLVTMDGLFLSALGGDMRYTPLWRMPTLRRGMPLDDISFEDEHFHPTITQLESNGEIYFVVGKEHSSIARLEGLETVKRLEFGKINITADSLAGFPETRVEAARKTERNVLGVRIVSDPPVIDGRLGEWDDAKWAVLDGRASAAVAVSQDTLYAAWKTGDKNAVESSPGDDRYQFKRGGALDLMIGTDPNADRSRQKPALGDLRLLVTQNDGSPRAVLYRAIAPQAPPGEAVLYDSPIGHARFDQVVNVTNQLRFGASGTGDFELSLPLAALGLAPPEPGQQFLADIGLLRGNAAQTTQRIYWNNRDTSLVSDIPSEARLRPGNWGIWEFRR